MGAILGVLPERLATFRHWLGALVRTFKPNRAPADVAAASQHWRSLHCFRRLGRLVVRTGSFHAFCSSCVFGIERQVASQHFADLRNRCEQAPFTPHIQQSA